MVTAGKFLALLLHQKNSGFLLPILDQSERLDFGVTRSQVSRQQRDPIAPEDPAHSLSLSLFLRSCHLRTFLHHFFRQKEMQQPPYIRQVASVAREKNDEFYRVAKYLSLRYVGCWN